VLYPRLFNMKKILIQGLDTLISQIGVLAIGMAASVLINRTLGPELKGALVSCLLIPQTAIVFAELGLGTSGAYQLSKKKYPAGSVILFLMVASFVLGVAAFLITGMLVHFPENEAILLNRFVILSIIIPGLGMTFIPEIYLGLGNLRGHNWWKAGSQGLRLLLLGSFIYIMENKLKAVLWAAVANYWFTFLISVILLIPKLRSEKLALKYQQIAESVKFGAKVFAGEVVGFLHYRLDIYLILFWRGNFEVGIYATAAFLSELIWMIPRGLYAPVFAEISKRGLSKKAIKKVAWSVLGITAVMALIAAFLIAPAIKLLYGNDFITSVKPFIILLPGTVMLSIPKFLEAPLIAEMGSPEILIQGKAAGLAINVLMNLWLIPRYGLSGAAVASSVSYSIQTFIFVFLFKKRAREFTFGKTEEYQVISEHESDLNEIPD
jgi:O-antigen/teichoic acid export membrane protein